ncbi:MAG: hypothetical protein IPL02_04240 [Moraxellaceae bacterium]|nr:hypothetical protein [Moraxellaceae bacterium]
MSLVAQEKMTVENLPALDWTQQFSQITPKHPLNILKGDFSVKTKSSLSGYWRYAAIFVGICFVTQLAFDAARLMHYQGVVKTTKNESTQLYKSLFPNESRIVNLRPSNRITLSRKETIGTRFCTDCNPCR